MPEIGIADKETLDKIDTNVGAKTDAASSTGSLHAKVKDVKSAVSTIAGKNIINHGSAIKSIQRGTIQLSTSETSKTATISSVNTSKTMLNFLGVRAAGRIYTFRDPSEPNYLLAVANTGHHFVTLQLTSSTQITVTRVESNSRDATVSYEVIE